MNSLMEIIMKFVITFITFAFARFLISFLRAFIWAIPTMLIWNKIFVNLINCNTMTYFQGYWISFVLLAMISVLTIKKD